MKLLSNETKHLSYNGTFLNGKQTAETLGVSPPTLSEAVKYGYNCSGYPVEEWVIRSESGRVKGYYVPEFLANKEDQESMVKENPQENPENSPENLSNKVDEKQVSENTTSKVTHNNYSLLPEGEDYFKPVGMASISSTIGKALESNTLQSKIVTVSGVVLLSSITGNEITGNGKGAMVGGGLGLGISLLAYYLDQPQNYHQAVPKQNQNNQPANNKEKKSGKLPEITFKKL